MLPLGIQTAIFVELMGFIVVVELTELKGWFSLWIVTDSTALVYKLMSKSMDVPWRIRVRWGKYQNILSRQLLEFHIYT